MKKTRFIVRGAVVAAVYAALTMVAAMFGLSSGVIQIRLSEALAVLPIFMPEAIWGLFVGCIISNWLSGAVAMDIIFGSIATLLGAIGTYAFRKRKYLPLLMPIISNSIIVPLVLKYAYGFPGSILYFVLTVGIGEILSCGVLGKMLILAINKRKMF